MAHSEPPDKPVALGALRKTRVFVASVFRKIEHYVLFESTFFRLHLTAFTFIPLIASAIFWGSNGQFKISYLDSLFLCYSAMTVTGLSTINLSTLTAWQQVILYLLMMIGDITIVSWVMVLVRKCVHCEWEHIEKHRRKPKMGRGTLLASISSPKDMFKAREAVPEKPVNVGPPPVVNYIGPTPQPTLLTNSLGLSQIDEEKKAGGSMERQQDPDASSDAHIGHGEPILSDADARTFTSSPLAQSIALSPVESRPNGIDFARTTSFAAFDRNGNVRRRTGEPPLYSQQTSTVKIPNPADTITQRVHSAGFPGPFQLMHRAVKRVAPKTYRKIERKMTIPYTRTIEGANTPWLTAETTIAVGRNSDIHFETLTDDVIEQIGGAEYIALRWLSYLVPVYFVTTQLIAFLLFAPWISVTHTYDDVFTSQFRLVSKPWFSLFQVMGAYTGGGLSLVDLGMLPFQTAYLMIIALMFVILAGNHALVLTLATVLHRWIGSKLAPKGSDADIAFDFLLHHPRRCFIYLFPSHQTWFLVICLVAFSAIEWIFFEILNIGLPAYESLSTGARIICGLFQGLAARASGFSIVPIASLAPALQFLYVVMMYIAVIYSFQVAMSIRSTNVYEERSLGVFEPPPEDEDEEPEDFGKCAPRQRVGRYLGWHLRRQMSIDIWWLVWAVFLIAIIERGNIMNEDLKWFDLFRVLFELVSAFGGIGLSLGLPTDNFSFAGALKPLSKLIIIVIMVRGRHRGLPVAVDKAVMLPNELVKREQNQPQNETSGEQAVP
ncbi:TrkH-domain-containing protein [Dendrothele bispora CBS 962.96]|uniref:TrkH-domain-containing protein n=1 Tax=Dendrothele bispora (strain CBS 962.96) TaxID=1314807 RepID=A0A4S8KM61_DENBC|nr:TrkH-domain-containing protein [Dendrothele bispora CBS 962.96]